MTAKTFKNPIIPGFYPDPSLCRVGDDYFLVTSTFEYFPGLPIFHSKDLVHWRQIGHVLDRPSQLNLDGTKPSGGLFAPTIRHHDGTFYVVNTLVEGHKGEYANFLVTSKDPAGPWSDPYWLTDAPGIDPSLFFDDDGRAWYCGNHPAQPEKYYGHREIWLQELDLRKMDLAGPKYGLWDGAYKNSQWTEGPHIYKVGGFYYLMVAESGTAHDQAVTIARSKSITGPYLSNVRNPILTHRNLGLDNPIVGPGHADIVETQDGEWWMVCLAMRPYGGYYYNLGRETFLASVRWEDGWPVVAPGVGKVEFEGAAPNLPERVWPSEPACDDFDAPSLSHIWNFIRTQREDWWSLSARPGFLRLRLRPEMITQRVNPSFVGRRQQHINFAARAAMEFTPKAVNECAGLVCLQNSDFQYRMVVTKGGDGKTVVRLVERAKAGDKTVAERAIEEGRIYFKVEARGQDYSFFASNDAGGGAPLAENVDGRILSTPVAGGFVGAYIGMYASSNGEKSANVADFDWFEYQGT